MLDPLKEYGLTDVQAKVYYHLLTLGRTSSTKVAKLLDVHRIYYTLAHACKQAPH